VIHELRKINIFGMGIQGRHNLCPIFMKNEELKNGKPDELSKLCIDRKNAVLKEDADACRYFHNSLKIEEGKIKSVLEGIPTVEEFSVYFRDRGLCAYELIKQFLSECHLVVAPYVYFLNPVIRKSLLEWMNVELKDVILIVDEAHNLEGYLRDLLTAQLSVKGLSLAGREALEHGNQEVLDIFTTADLCLLISNLINKFSDEYIGEEDALLPRSALEDELLLDIGTSRKLDILTKNLLLFGETIRELRRKNGRLPRSHIYHIGSFLNIWTNSDDECYVKLISDRKNPTLQLYCVDPREATAVMKSCHSTIHMSGTLRPLEEYRDSIGLPDDTILREYPSPFPAENCAIFYANDVTTKYEEFKDDDNRKRLRKHILNISKVKKNTAFFFPSHDIMNEFLDTKHESDKSIFVEKRGIGQEELVSALSRFKLSRNSTIFGVMGGRICEGIDFPDEELEMVVIVGIPYPKPSAKQKALVMYYDLKFKKGWEYTVHAPTARRIRQAIGRLIRRENDRGLAVILDRRAKSFSKELDNIKKLDSRMSEIEDFFTPR
jgi:DNA excision repair protein ERCC-2